MRSQRARSRLYPRDLGEHFGRTAQYLKVLEPPSPEAHANLHVPQILVYTSKATLDTDAGTPFFNPFGGTIAWVKLSVAGAPTTGPLQADLLLDGTSALDGTYIEVPAGQQLGYLKPADKLSASDSMSIQFQIVAINGATGPMVAYVCLIQG